MSDFIKGFPPVNRAGNANGRMSNRSISGLLVFVGRRPAYDDGRANVHVVRHRLRKPVPIIIPHGGYPIGYAVDA